MRSYYCKLRNPDLTDEVVKKVEEKLPDLGESRQEEWESLRELVPQRGSAMLGAWPNLREVTEQKEEAMSVDQESSFRPGASRDTDASGEGDVEEPQRRRRRVLGLPARELIYVAPEDLVALKFIDTNVFDTALDRALEKGIPFDVPGELTLIIEHSRSQVFKDLVPEMLPVLSAGDLLPEEIATLHRRHFRP